MEYFSSAENETTEVTSCNLWSRMAASGDVTIAQDGGPGNVIHPYLLALVRWCVSCVWSTATLLLHRLIAGSLPAPSIAGFTAKQVQKARAAGNEHLHPEPRVECQVLHAPDHHGFDVIFVHGLYGSLGNTWRQGDWISKYKIGPNIVPLLRPKNCKCEAKSNESKCETNESTFELKINEITYNDFDAKVYRGVNKIIPNEEEFIAEKFFSDTLLDQVEIVDNFETQAKFVRDLFENENRICGEHDEFENELECELNEVCCKMKDADCKCKVEVDCRVGEVDCKVGQVNCECKVNDGRKCEVGCGCVCDECYSSCWPRDWVREDYPDARIISINYTSDPYLWRPLWIKECKRLRLHERAEQMTKQLLELGVGEKPVIWVGHSKGGLFIKQIYCEAYEAYIKYNNKTVNRSLQNDTKYNIENKPNPSDIKNNNNNSNNRNTRETNLFEEEDNTVIREDHFNANNAVSIEINDNIDNEIDVHGRKRVTVQFEGEEILEYAVKSSNTEEDQYALKQANLWRRSAGFMFYSVPHRGSALADIKTPITARSIELLEISKDNSLVVSLQDRWLKATAPARPHVRSLVETCRTLMAVLWLRIVSVPSADAGIGALYGVSVDHREICKPTSRRCLLYNELMALMRASLNQCRCDT